MKKIYLFNAFVFLFITLFCVLGSWQIYRLQLKQELITQINNGLKSSPITYSEKIKKNYQRVTLNGKYDFKNQIYLYSLNEKGQPGYDVITPFQTINNENVLINRGWINKEDKNTQKVNFTRKNKISGLLKKNNKPNIFKPENDIKNNIWFSINLTQIKNITGQDFNSFIVYLEDITTETPKAKKITVDVPNNHLKYAITWYSLSISIFAYFLYFRKKNEIL